MSSSVVSHITQPVDENTHFHLPSTKMLIPTGFPNVLYSTTVCTTATRPAASFLINNLTKVTSPYRIPKTNLISWADNVSLHQNSHSCLTAPLTWPWVSKKSEQTPQFAASLPFSFLLLSSFILYNFLPLVQPAKVNMLCRLPPLSCTISTQQCILSFTDQGPWIKPQTPVADYHGLPDFLPVLHKNWIHHSFTKHISLLSWWAYLSNPICRIFDIDL